MRQEATIDVVSLRTLPTMSEFSTAVKEASAMLLGSLLPEDAYEPYKVGMAMSAYWPGEKWVVPEAAALKSGKAHSFWELIGPERFACYCEVQREGKFGSYKVQHLPELKAITSKKF